MGVISLDLQQTDAGANKWSYNWLTDLPSINGVTIQGDLTLEDLDIIIPTKVSELENDAGYITEEALGDRFYTKDEVYNKGETYNKGEVDSILEDYYTSDEVDTKIGEEATARAGADSALSNRIDTNATNINSLAGDVAANSRAISDEATARQNADSALSGRIDTNAANIATNTTNIATNTANIATNTANIATNTTDIAANTTAISNEATARQNADSGLSDRITANTTAISTNTANIATNTTNIATNTANIATNTANIATNTANIATNASDIAGETDAREIADQGLQEQIDALAASSDVVDIVGTYAALQAYDTSKLHDNDIIKVLDDETRNDATTYYRWSVSTSTWSYIGAEGPFYTKADADATFVPQTRTINSKALSSNVTLTAQDVGALPDSTVIPTVNNATLTIQKNGTTVQTFTANSSSNKTANITVPTKTSDLTNDGDGTSNFATETYVDTYGGKIDVIKVNGTAQTITNKTVDISVPTKTSDITNDSGYITSSSLPTKTSDLTNDGSDGTSTYVESDNLATVATSGSYNDLSNKPTIPTVNNGTLTIQKNGTTVQTFTANQSSNATANITVPTDTNDLTNGAGFITSSGSITGNAATATKLAAGKTIALGTGATGTATSFDGSSNITIPVTDVKDAYVTWGGKPLYSAVSPDDAGCIDEFSHNKLAFLPANCIQVHYSTDGGSTWTDYGLTDAQKIQLVTYGDVYCRTGGETAPTSSNVTNLKVRIRIATAASTTTTGAGSLYTDWCKVLLNVNDPRSDCSLTMRYRTIGNYKSGTETWVDSGTTYPVRGGTAWNSIPRPSGWPAFGGNYAKQTTQIGQLEFILSNTRFGTWGDRKGSICSIRMIGMSNWEMPSEMARTGRLYTIDDSKSATFPASIYAGSDISAYNIYYRGGSKYGHIGSSTTPFKDIYLSDGIYNGSIHLNLPTTAGTLALTSDMPTVNNATLTIQKNGTNVQTFTANQSTNATANITVPTKTSDITNDSNFVASGDLAAVATSGSYNDLSNKPTIPTVNNATLTIQKNGSTVKTFTANASSNVTANITVPTSTSELTNDAGFIDEIPVASAGTLGGVKVGSNLSIDASGVLSADADSVWTANNLSPAANTPASWKTLLGGEGVYWTWYTVANKFTNQPATYGFLRTVIGGSDIRQDFYVQTGGEHYYRTGNGTGWYGQSSNAGAFRYLGNNVDSALSTTSSNPVKNSVVTNALNDKANSADLATVATSGSYNDLTNKPTIPAAQVNSDWNASSGVAKILNKPSLATVATSGSYNDLSNKPTIPTVNNATLTIQKNGTTVQTFTANSSSNKTANIQVPNLQTSSTDPGEGSALAADTFLGIYDIAPEDVDGARLVNGSVTSSKIDWSTMDELFYKSGDTITATVSGNFDGAQIMYTGFLTSGNKNCVISIPVQKRLDNITSATINSLYGYARCQGGYLTNMNNNQNIVAQSTSVVTTIHPETNSITVCFVRSSGWGATNNSSVSLAATSVSITLS